MSALREQLPRENWRLPLYGSYVDRTGYPISLPILPEGVPKSLTPLRRWVAWDWSLKEDRLLTTASDEQISRGDAISKKYDGIFPYKVPISPITGDSAASGPQVWGTFSETLDFVQTTGVAGLGFVITGTDSIIAIDIDDCFEPIASTSQSAPLHEWAAKLVEDLQTYVEYSPSGNGLHVWATGPHPGLFEFQATAKIQNKPVLASPFFRAFDSKAGIRPLGFLTVTGHHFDGSPLQTEYRGEQLDTLLRKCNVSWTPPSPDVTADQQELHWIGAHGEQAAHPLFGDFEGMKDRKQGISLLSALPAHNMFLNDSFASQPPRRPQTQRTVTLTSMPEDRPVSIRIASDWIHATAINVDTNEDIWRVKGHQVEGLPLSDICYITGPQFALAAIDIITGKCVWKIEQPSQRSFWYPYDAGDHIFGSTPQGVCCADWKNGLLLWSAIIGAGDWRLVHISPELAIAHQRKALVAIDRLSGIIRWRIPLEKPILQLSTRLAFTPLQFVSDNRSCYFWQLDGGLVAVDLATGAVEWEFNPGLRDDVASLHGQIAVIAGPHEVVAQSSHMLYGLAKK